MLGRRITLAVVFGVIVAGCGARSAPGDDQNRTTPGVTSAVNDPKLDAAADSVTPALESTFPDAYSGVEMKHVDHMMIIYRVPDPNLDEFVRSRIPDITVSFRDAKLSRIRMQALTNRILRDQEVLAEPGDHHQRGRAHD